MLPAADAGSPMGQLVGPHMLFEILLGIQRGPSLEHDNIQSALGQHFGAVPPPAPDPMMQTSYYFGERTTCGIQNLR